MLNFPFFIAKRYLISKKSYNAINLISYISVFGIAVGTMALIVVLSVYNGFDEFIKGMYNAFDPDFRITVAEGKVFSEQDKQLQYALSNEAIELYTPVLEETALIEYRDQQAIAKMKGVGQGFSTISRIDSAVSAGFYMPKYEGRSYACLGAGVAYRISFNLDFERPLNVWMPKRGKKGALNPATAFNSIPIVPSGVFSIEPEFDMEYFIVPIDFAQKLLDYDSTQVSHIEILAKADANLKKLKEQLEVALGKKYVVKNRFQQREMLYKIMQSERWAIFLILLFILIVVSFNLLASLSMLIIDKKKDISTLQSLGADQRQIRHIFVFEGWMVTAIGSVLGLLWGYLIVWLQDTFGFVGFPGDSQLLLQAYPVKVLFSDFLLVLATVGIVGFGATYLPARFVTRWQFQL